MSGLRVAFVLRLVDDFTGRPVAGRRFLFRSGGRAIPSVYKTEGMYVFLEPVEKAVRLQIEGAGYHPREVLINRDLLDLSEPVVNIRLYGRPDLQKYSCGCEWLTGRLGEERGPFPAEVTAERIRPVGLTFLKYEQTKEENRLFFRGFTKEEMIGHPYLLDGMNPPVPFVLTERRGINEYLAELSEDSSWKAAKGASLMRIYRSVSDSSGAYAIPVESREECRLL